MKHNRHLLKSPNLNTDMIIAGKETVRASADTPLRP